MDSITGGTVTHVGVALSFAFVVTAMVYALGPVSGAHINPAVTIGLWSVGRFPRALVLPYVAAQCTAAIAASLTLRACLGPVANLGATIPAVSIASAFGIEWLLSFALMLVVMAVITERGPGRGIGALAIGMTVGFCALMGGPITGASMNPARSLGPSVVGALWKSQWIYWLAPVSAMIAAARLHRLLAPATAARVVPQHTTDLDEKGEVA